MGRWVMALVALVIVIPVLLVGAFYAYDMWYSTHLTVYRPVFVDNADRRIGFGIVRTWNGQDGYVLIRENGWHIRASVPATNWDALVKDWNDVKAGQSAPRHPIASSFGISVRTTPALGFEVRNGGSCASYDVPPSQIAEVDAALASVKNGFDHPPASAGYSPSLHEAFRSASQSLMQRVFPSHTRPLREGC